MKYAAGFLTTLYFSVISLSLFFGPLYYILDSYTAGECTINCVYNNVTCPDYYNEYEREKHCTPSYTVNYQYTDRNNKYSETEEIAVDDFDTYCQNNRTVCYFDRNLIHNTLNIDKLGLLTPAIAGLVIVGAFMLLMLSLTIMFGVKFCMYGVELSL